jgi:hypothetical protein
MRTRTRTQALAANKQRYFDSFTRIKSRAAATVVDPHRALVQKVPCSDLHLMLAAPDLKGREGRGKRKNLEEKSESKNNI